MVAVPVPGIVAVEVNVPPVAAVPYQFNVPPIAGVAVNATGVAFWQYVILVTIGANGFTVTVANCLGLLVQKLNVSSYCST